MESHERGQSPSPPGFSASSVGQHCNSMLPRERISPSEISSPNAPRVSSSGVPGVVLVGVIEVNPPRPQTLQGGPHAARLTVSGASPSNPRRFADLGRITMSSRFLRAAIQRPMISSDIPGSLLDSTAE